MTDRMILLLAAVGLVPIGLSYGLMPATSLGAMLGIPVEGVNLTHIFRAIMGLYLATAAFWLAGVLRPDLRRPALWSLFIFMAGLAAGRVLSLFLDGFPSVLLMVYLGLEVLFAAAALWALQTSRGPEQRTAA